MHCMQRKQSENNWLRVKYTAAGKHLIALFSILHSRGKYNHWYEEWYYWERSFYMGMCMIYFMHWSYFSKFINNTLLAVITANASIAFHSLQCLFMYTVILNIYIISERYVLLSSPIYKWGNQGWEVSRQNYDLNLGSLTSYNKCLCFGTILLLRINAYEL